MIKGFLEQAIRNIEAERERAVATVKDRVSREKIAPYNADLDAARVKAIRELDLELNTKVVALQEEYAKKKQSLVEIGEQDKQKHAETVLASELALITIEYDKNISKLKEQIAEVKE